MTESGLLYLLFSLTIVRLILHLQPAVLKRVDKILLIRVKEVIDSIVWAGVVALLLIHFVVRSFYIPSGSMLPTLRVNDFILVNEFLYDFAQPSRGEIVVFHPPPAYTGDKSDIIKRVVGVEGDTVEVREGQLLLNGVTIQENFILEPMAGTFGPERVRKAHVFVMGDNRNDSNDSRYIGQIPLKNLVGRAEVVFFPLSRWQFFNLSN